MLDMGFHGDIMRIAEKCKKDRQTLLFSATMPDRIETLSKDLLNNPVTVKLALSKPAEKIKQGGQGVWGPMPMQAMSQLDDTVVAALALWLASGQ